MFYRKVGAKIDDSVETEVLMEFDVRLFFYFADNINEFQGKEVSGDNNIGDIILSQLLKCWHIV